MTRETMSNRRISEGFDFRWQGIPFAVQVGYYDDLRVGEVFISSPKIGSASEINARDAAVLLSLALQLGAEPKKVLDSLTHDAEGRPEGVVGQILNKVLADMPAKGVAGPEIIGEANAVTLAAPIEGLTTRDIAIQQGYTGDECTNCHSVQMRRNGACMVCDSCGTTTGCS